MTFAKFYVMCMYRLSADTLRHGTEDSGSCDRFDVLCEHVGKVLKYCILNS